MKAMVRGLASSFVSAISSQPSASISLQVAQQQHGAYVQLLRGVLGNGNVLELAADEKHPDCCFIEDTAVVVGRTAIVARIGAAARQGEEAPVAAALQNLLGYNLQHIQTPGTLDGGDVLQLPGSGHILVGLSGRTNAAALQQMQEMLPQHTLHGVSVAHGLHLKSACTALDSRTMVYADDDAGRGLKSILQEHPAFKSNGSGNASSGSSGGDQQPWQHVVVDPACANLLLLGDKHVVMRGGFPESEGLLGRLAAARGLQLHKLDFGEFAKADGSLTCCSILLPSV